MQTVRTDNTASRRTISRWAFRALYVSVVASMLTPVLATPSISFGIWHQAEPVLAGILVCAGLAAVSMALLTWSSPRLVRALGWSLALLPALVVLWGTVMLPFVQFPGRSLFGSPELKEGLFWYAALAVLVMAIRLFWTRRRWATAVLTPATALVLIVAVATYLRTSVEVTILLPLFFADYLAFAGFFIAAAGVSLAGRAPPAYVAVVVLCGIVTVATSTNNSAIALLAAAPLVGAVAWWMSRRIGARRTRRAAVAGLATAGIGISLLIWLYAFEFVTLDNKLVEGVINSIASRHLLIQIVGEALSAAPSFLLSGQGYGTFTDSFIAHLPVDWVTLRDDTQFWALDNAGGIVSGNWDAVLRVDFHSHNVPADHLLYGGVVGCAAAVALFLSPILLARRDALPSVVMGTFTVFMLSIVWFLPITILAPMALWLGSTPSGRIGSASLIPRARVAAAGSLVAGAALIAAGIWAADFSRYAYYFGPAMRAPIAVDTAPAGAVPAPANCPAPFRDARSGGIHLAHRLDTMTQFVKRTVVEDRPIEKHPYQSYRGIVCATLASLASGEGSRQLQVAFLRSVGELAFIARLGDLDVLFKTMKTAWAPVLERFVVDVPARTDMAATFLLHALAEGDQQEFARIAPFLYEKSPGTPVAQWFYGIHLLEGAKPEAGLALMKQALETGVERFLPVDPTLKAEVLGLDERSSQPVVRRLSIIGADTILTVYAEIADTEDARELGLQGRLSLPRNGGMLLVFDEPQAASVWMKDTYFPIDILFIGQNGRILDIVEGAIPQSVSEIGPVDDVAFVLEVPAGVVEHNGIRVGDVMRY